MKKIAGCVDCKHLVRDSQTKDKRTKCNAYPNGIPFEILFDGVPHLKKRTDQNNNILFESVNPLPK